MKKFVRHTSILFLLAGLIFGCRGGVHKNNDHDYDGKNENNDHIDGMSDQADTTNTDSAQYRQPDTIGTDGNRKKK